jgi:hypothetical protein
MPLTVTHYCAWCAQALTNEYTDPVLTGIFGYHFCSQACRDALDSSEEDASC